MDRLSFRSQTDAAGFTQFSNLVLLDLTLSDGAKVTYLMLLHHARQAGKCFPGQDRLAAERGISDRSVRSHLAELVKRGLITVERRGKPNTNLYWIESLDTVYRKESATQENDRKKTAGYDRKKTADPKERLEKESTESESQTLNVGERLLDKSFLPEVHDLAKLTRDSKSLRRFGQLYDLAMKSGNLHVWDEAVRSLRKRMEASDKEPLRSAGAYFCKTLSELLLARGISVPVGSKAEREDIRAQLRVSLGEGEE